MIVLSHKKLIPRPDSNQCPCVCQASALSIRPRKQRLRRRKLPLFKPDAFNLKNSATVRLGLVRLFRSNSLKIPVFGDLYVIKFCFFIKIGKRYRIIIFWNIFFSKKQSRIRYKNTISVKFLSHQKLIPRPDSNQCPSVCQASALSIRPRKQRLRWRKLRLFKPDAFYCTFAYQKLIPRVGFELTPFGMLGGRVNH